MINIPRLTATTVSSQVAEMKAAMVKIVNEANSEIQRLERKIMNLEGKRNDN